MNGSVRTWPAIDVHPASELLQAALMDYEVSAVDERTPDTWRVFFSSSVERDRAASGLRTTFPGLAVETVDVADEDWAARSQASLPAIRVGDIVVAPPWDVPADRRDGGGRPAVVVVIRPSMGFGTGHHATTRLCLAALQRLDLHGRRVIDVGTGSGVLAIAASLLGAGPVTAIDDDADAVAAARENLELNAAATRVTLVVGDLRSADLAPADVVVANLTGGLLEVAASRLRQLTAAGGRLVLSGIMAEEERQVLAAFPTSQLEHREQEDEWVCVMLR